jgi:hypothetical protein
MSETALLNPYASHYMMPFASFIISTRTPMGPSFERLAGGGLPVRVWGYPCPSCQSFVCAVGLRSLPEDAIVRVGFPLIVPDLILVPFGLSVLVPP